MVEYFKGFTNRNFRVEPIGWSGHMDLGLHMNTRGKTSFKNSMNLLPSRRPAERLNDDISLSLCEEIDHSASNEAGILKLRQLTYVCADHMIYVDTYYKFYLYSGKVTREKIFELCERYLKEVAFLVNEFFEKYGFRFPIGPCDFYGYFELPEKDAVNEDTVSYESSFWLPIGKGAPELDFDWYFPRVTGGCYPEKAADTLNTAFEELDRLQKRRPDVYGGEKS